VLSLILEALAHLHAHRIHHLDIKPENILLDGAGRPHIADYDISQDGATRAIRRKTLATRMGTDGFIAPEVEAGGAAGAVSAAADLFSLGRTVEAVVPDEPLRRPETLLDLIAQLTRADPAARPSAAQAARHAYFAPLLAGRFEGVGTCVVCQDTLALSSGLRCTATLDGAQHFTCLDCLDVHTRRSSLQLPPSGDGEDDEAERARMLRQRMQRQGRICCPMHPRECAAAPFAEAELARALPPGTFQAYMASRQELTEQRLEREKEERMQELLKAELERLRTMDEHERAVRTTSSEIAAELTMRCPRCGAAFVDFHGCCALSCSSCPAHFCAWCLAPAADSPANHRHVASCRAKPDGADAYYPGAHWQPFLNERRRRVVRDALARLDPELAGEVFDVLQPQIADLRLRRPGMPDGGSGGAAASHAGQEVAQPMDVDD